MLWGEPTGEIGEDDLEPVDLTPDELERVKAHAFAANRGGAEALKERSYSTPADREAAGYALNMLGMFGEAAFCKWFTRAITIWDKDCNARDKSKHKSDGGYDFPVQYGAPIQVKCRPLDFGWDTWLLDFLGNIKEGFYYVLTMRASRDDWERCLIVGWATAGELKASPINKYQPYGWNERRALAISELHPMRTFPLAYDPVTDKVVKKPGG